jgi:hypothetical protein
MRRRLAYHVDLQAAARAAVRRSAGRCEAFWAEIFVDNDFFLFLADAAPMLKSLRLISCNGIPPHRMNEVIRRFPLLEELEISHYDLDSITTCLAGVGAACPLLTRLRLNHDRFYYWRPGDTGGCEAAEIAAMPGLRSLQLFANSLRNADLAAILDGCRRLESLDIRHCFNVSMNGEMRARCAGVKALQMPKDSMEGYDLPYASPVRDCVYYSGVMYPDF